MMKKLFFLVFVVVLSASSAHAEFVMLTPGSLAKEFPAESASVCLQISDFDVPVRIIMDSGKTIRINSEIPMDVAVVSYAGKPGELTVRGNTRNNGAFSVGVGASVSNFKNKGRVTQVTHGDSSPVISSSGNVTISYGEGENGETGLKKGIMIRVPRGMRVKTRNLSGDLKFIQ